MIADDNEKQEKMVEEPFTEQATEPPPPLEPEGKEPEKIKVETSRGQRILRLLLGLLIFFGLGAMLVIFLLYIPLRDQATTDRQELTAANQQIDALEGQIDEMEVLQTRTQTLQKEADLASLHIAILGAQVDVARARLALEQEDAARAEVHLGSAERNLQRMAELMPSSQSQIVSDLQERLNLAQQGLQDDAFAAKSDLDVLMANLVDLENNLF